MEPDNTQSTENADTGKPKDKESSKDEILGEHTDKNTKDDTNITKETTETNTSLPKRKKITEECIDKLHLELLTDGEDEGDDVPRDFFDDFLKEDFMAGLDVVDDDEWDEEKSQVAKKSTDNPQSKPPSNDSEKKKTPIKGPPKGGKVKPLNKGKNKKIYKQKQARQKKKNAAVFEIQRDPKKTLRDIVRDKERCEKDREKKIISEKLQLVETGLVPPGMEMETDIDIIKKQSEDLKHSNSPSAVPAKSLKSEKIPPKKESVILRKRPSPIQLSPIRRYRSRSPRHESRMPRHISRSPRRKSRTPTRLAMQNANRSRRFESPNRRSRDHRSSERFRRSRSRSSTYRRRRRSRSRTRSPKRRREEKKSFLQEIAEKLNETRPASIPYQTHLPTGDMYHMPQQVLMPSPVPAPTPMTTQYPHRPQQYDHYDQSYFIGAPQMQQNVKPPNIHLVNQMQMPVQQQSGSIPQMNANFNNSDFQSNSTTRIQEETNANEDFNRLFQDKKLTLTEFLSITAKPEVYAATPSHMREKIRVISRCQDAIKYLGDSEKKFAGPLMIQRNQKVITPEDKFRSPLIKSSLTKFPFTEMPQALDQKSEYSAYIKNFLDNLGLADDVIVIDDGDTEDYSATNSQTLIPPAPIISSGKRRIKPTQSEKPALGNAPSKLAQTESTRCGNCDRRNKTVYKSIGVQCGGDSMSFSISTQVREDDFYPKLPKGQSLASLTPAQLLARSGSSMPFRNIDADDFDLFPLKKNARPAGLVSYPYPPESYRYSPPMHMPPSARGPGGPRGPQQDSNSRYYF